MSWNFPALIFTAKKIRSRSTWACELKSLLLRRSRRCHVVTLHVSVWVEIGCDLSAIDSITVTLHVSVWVEMLERSKQSYRGEGHAPRERVSWNPRGRHKAWGAARSRSTWACELKLHGCWRNNSRNVVTLHVSVWVEIFKSSGRRELVKVTLHVSVWVEIDLGSFRFLRIRPVTLHVSVWVEI